jgi:hypothetical protein
VTSYCETHYEICVIGTLNALTLWPLIERRERPAHVRAEREPRIRAVDEMLMLN